ncbi:MAG: DUF58 domain-containing protein [Bacillota bacterium]
MENNNAVGSSISIFSLGVIRLSLFIILVILLRFALWLPAILISLLLVAVEGALWWSKMGFKNLAVENTLFPLRIFPNEETIFKITIRNPKRLPAIITWEQQLPQDLLPLDNETEKIAETVTLMSQESYGLTRRISASKRGFYEFPSSYLISSDGLGLFHQEREESSPGNLIVYPRIIPLPQLNINPSDFIGEKRDKRIILPDPVKIMGLREYTADMPARLINWKASVHKDTLLARTLEPSADHKIYIMIDVFYFHDLLDKDGFEKALSVAASLVVWADENNIPFGLLVNGVQKGQEGAAALQVGSGIGHLLQALEKLARLTFTPWGSIEELLQLEGISFSYGTTCVTIGREMEKGIVPGIGRVYHYRLEGVVCNE